MKHDGHISDSSCHTTGIPLPPCLAVPRPGSIRDSFRQWPALAQAALVLLLALQAGRVAWEMAAPVAPPSAAPLPTPTQVPALSGYDPFFGGRTAAADTGLQGWTLYGVRTGSRGSAILGRGDGPQAAYRVGDELGPGLVLERVAADHVIVRDGDRARRLDLPGPADAAASAAAASPPTAAPAPASAAAQTPARDVDPVRLLAETGLKVRFERGGIGYEIMPRGDGRLLQQAGLQPGDVLLSINGQPLGPGQLPEVRAQLEANPHAVVGFRRGGQVHTVTLGSGNP